MREREYQVEEGVETSGSGLRRGSGTAGHLYSIDFVKKRDFTGERV